MTQLDPVYQVTDGYEPLEHPKLSSLSASVTDILTALGVDLQDPNFHDTPGRVAASLIELTSGMYNTQGRIEDILSAKFPANGYDEMVHVRHIETVGLCPHHLLPIYYEISLAYIPGEFVLGLSKLGRLAEVLSARPVLQERLVVDICTVLEHYLHPVGTGCITVGKHGCMNCRGFKQRNVDTVTTKLTGAFKNATTREEFLLTSGLFK